MYEKAFYSKLARAELGYAYLFYGGCELSLWLLAHNLQKAYAPDVVLKMTELDFDAKRAVEFLKTNDLFYSKKLLKIELYKEELKSFKLADLKAAANADARLMVIIHTQRPQKSAEKAFGEDFVRVFAREMLWQKTELLSDLARSLEIKASRADLQKLAEHYSADLAQAGAELRKFTGDTLRLEMCDFASVQLSEFDELFAAMFRPGLEINELKNMLLEGEEIAIINRFSAAFLRLFKLSAHAKTYGRIDFSVALGYSPPPNVRKELEIQALRCADKIEEILKTIIISQDEIIAAECDAKAELLALICKIYSLINH